MPRGTYAQNANSQRYAHPINSRVDVVLTAVDTVEGCIPGKSTTHVIVNADGFSACRHMHQRSSSTQGIVEITL